MDNTITLQKAIELNGYDLISGIAIVRHDSDEGSFRLLIEIENTNGYKFIAVSRGETIKEYKTINAAYNDFERIAGRRTYIPLITPRQPLEGLFTPFELEQE
jgi:hypothetical protein